MPGDPSAFISLSFYETRGGFEDRRRAAEKRRRTQVGFSTGFHHIIAI
jgi:hypothetical protein